MRDRRNTGSALKIRDSWFYPTPIQMLKRAAIILGAVLVYVWLFH